ncbi:MAG: PEP-CTERM sorting domain-containing protein [Crocosphaera sp.]
MQEANAAILVDVTGVAGSGTTTWTLSGSTTAQSGGSFNTNVITGFDDGTTEILGPNDGNFIADAGIQDTVFSLLSGSATITAGSNSESLTGMFLDDDTVLDDIGFRVASSLAYSGGDTISFSGTFTLGVDLNQLIQDNYDQTVPSLFLDGTGDDFVLNISEQVQATPEPTSLVALLGLGGLGFMSRRKKQK